MIYNNNSLSSVNIVCVGFIEIIICILQIQRVEKINNPHLYGIYLLWKEEFENSNLYAKGKLERKILYHATSSENAKNIALSNIDWRKTVRSRFGIGACFSPCPEYAHRYAGSKGGK